MAQRGSRGATARTAATLACALAVTAGCSSSTVSGTPSTEAPAAGSAAAGTTTTGAPAVDDSLPVTPGGTAYQPLALTLADLPPGWTGSPVTAAQAAEAPRTTVADPPECAEIGATRTGTADDAFLVIFSRVDPFNTLFENISPAGSPTLDEVEARVRQCASFTQSDPAAPEPQSVTTELVEAPPAPAGRSVGVRQLSTVTYQGEQLTFERLELLTEVRGALVSVVGLSGTRDPLDAALVRDSFTTAVARLAG